MTTYNQYVPRFIVLVLTYIIIVIYCTFPGYYIWFTHMKFDRNIMFASSIPLAVLGFSFMCGPQVQFPD